MTTAPSSAPDSTSGAALKTLLLSDLVGSTKLVEGLGDERAFAIFGRHDRVARDLLQQCGGREIDKTDGFLHLFERPIDAVLYAGAYHQALARLSEEEGVELAARVGIYLGEVFLRENSPEDVARGAKPLEVEGLAKPMAARLMSLAQGRQTLLSLTAFDVARRAAVDVEWGDGELSWVAHGHYQLKGVEEPVPVFEVGVEGFSRLAPPPDSDKVRRVAADPTIRGWRPAPGVEVPHRRNWQLREKLGEGGFGEVWLAVHGKTGDARVFKFCFESERLSGLKREVTLFRLLKEALGARDDIARILDWSFDEPPYFLEAEYTEGGSLGDWLSAQGGVKAVSLEVRLELVAQTGQALAAAHSVGVLHKDLKPANILVDSDRQGTPQIQLADFGIGVVTDRERLGEHGITMMGLTQELAPEGSSGTGTVVYMAPEQLAGQPPTVQADIYALGVILFQLVVGDLGRVMAPGWERDVDDELLREDIAAAVDGMPERRLADAAELARRLRGLGDRRARQEAEAREREEAAAARQALARAARRRKVLLVAGAVLIAFTAAMALQVGRTVHEARRADREAAAARTVLGFLVDVFEVSDPSQARGSTVTARELLDRGAERIDRELAGDPLTRARLMDTMGTAYLKLGLYGEAAPLLEGARDLRLQHLDDDHPEVAASRASLGVLYGRQGRHEEALELLGQALDTRRRTLGNEHSLVAETLSALAQVHRARGRFADALPLERQAEAIRRASSGPAAAGPGLDTGGAPEIMSLGRSVTLAPDVRQVLGRAPRPGLAVAAGANGLYLVDLDTKAAPTQIALGSGERVVAGLDGGVPVIRSGDRVLARQLFTRSATPADHELLRGLDPAEGVAVDRSGHTLARVASDRIRVYQLEPDQARQIVDLRLPVPPAEVAVSKLYLAFTQGEEVVVHSLEEDREVLRARDWEGRVTALAVDDHARWLAVGGWYDEVAVYDLSLGGEPEIVRLAGQTHDLCFLPDHPSLVVAKEGGLALWRSGAGVLFKFTEPGAAFACAGFSAAGLMVHERAQNRLLTFNYRSFPVSSSVQVSASPVWAAGAAATGEAVHLGTADGQLHRWHAGSADLRSVQAHSQGLTSLLCRDGKVITGADDKTIGIFDAQTLTEISRSRAHAFLVNFLLWDEASSTVWTSSSDGAIKAWTWPGMEERTAIEAGPHAKASFWLSSQRGLALVGTWAQRWLELELEEGRWLITREQPTESRGIYSVVEQPRLGVVALMGVNPTTIWLYDLESRRAWELERPDLALNWAVAVGPDRIVFVGDACVVSYRLQRIGDSIAYDVSVGLSSEVGELSVAATVPASGLLVAGSGDGHAVLLDPAGLPQEVLFSGRVGEG